MDELNIDCKEVTVKSRRPKKVAVKRRRPKKLNSKIFKCLKSCLDKRKHSHMLSYINEDETEFEVRLFNKKSPRWEKKNISLFIELDNLSSKKRSAKNYEEKCKVRFKSNMTKLKNYIKEISSEKLSTVLTVKKYRILWKISDVEDQRKREITAKNKKKVGNCSNETTSCVNSEQISSCDVSHFSCLSPNLYLRENKFDLHMIGEINNLVAKIDLRDKNQATSSSDMYVNGEINNLMAENNLLDKNQTASSSDMYVNGEINKLIAENNLLDKNQAASNFMYVNGEINNLMAENNLLDKNQAASSFDLYMNDEINNLVTENDLLDKNQVAPNVLYLRNNAYMDTEENSNYGNFMGENYHNVNINSNYAVGTDMDDYSPFICETWIGSNRNSDFFDEPGIHSDDYQLKTLSNPLLCSVNKPQDTPDENPNSYPDDLDGWITDFQLFPENGEMVDFDPSASYNL